MTDEIPMTGKNSFTCPHCGVRAQQLWSQARLVTSTAQSLIPVHWLAPEDYQLSACFVCKRFAFWHNSKLAWPETQAAPPCSSDCSAEVATVYQEAREVYSSSPRASAALLRLAIQMICRSLVSSEKDLNKAIAKLVEEGLPKKIQQALDVVRVVGNNAVHPGTINLNDDPSVALKLFSLVNMIVDSMITQPKQIEEMFGGLPETALEQIQKRDS